MIRRNKEIPDVTKMSYEEEAEFWDNNSPLDFIDPDDLEVSRGAISPKIIRVESVKKGERISFSASSVDVAQLKSLAAEKNLDLSTFMRLIYRHYLDNKDDISLA